MKSEPYLSYNQTLFFKGIAILCILLHNFFHLLPPVMYQNEMSFEKYSGFRFLREFYPSEFLNSFFSFFGFYGVYVFIFLSGYGLTKSFLLSDTGGGIWFIIKHIVKIYKLFLISIGLYVLYFFPDVNFTRLLYSLSLTNNFFPDRLFSVNGPWWFFSLIIQLYILFIPLYRFLKKGKMNIFCIFYIYLVMAVFILYFGETVIEFYANFGGHLPEFAMGIYIALYEKELPFLYNRKKNIYIAITTLAIIVGAQFFRFFFIFSFAASCIFTFSFFYALKWRENHFFQYTGQLSPFLFGFNGFLFRHYWVGLAELSDNAFLKLCYCVCWLLLNYSVAALAFRIFGQHSTSATSKT